MVRKRFLLSGAIVCLMLSSGLAYAQSPGDARRDEPKKDRLEKSEPAKAGQSRSESRPEERTRERSESSPERGNPSARQTGEEHRPSTSTQHTGSPRQEEQNRARNEGSKQNQQDRARTESSNQDERNRARSEGSKQNERADQSRGNREEGNKASSPADKSARDQSGRDKSTQQSDKSSSGTAPNESPQSQRGEATKASPTQSQSQESARPTNRTGAANETDRSRTPNEAQRGAGDGSQTTTSTSISDNQGRLSRDKEVRISETMRSRELAPPERNLAISIRVGTEIPDRVRVHRLPPEILSIEPQYRDYDYFTTEEEIVIVEPRTHRVVSTVPKDASRARAEVRGGPANSDGRAGQTTANAEGNRAAPCQIMRRDGSGQLSDVSSTTVGSSRDRQNSIVVTVETPDQQSTQPIALDAPAGQIIVATQGQGDCQVIIEPQGNR